MKITWTNCADAMPPDDTVIAKVRYDDTLFRVSGILVKQKYSSIKIYQGF